MTTAPSRPVKMAVTPVAVIRHVVALDNVLLCVSVIVFLVNCGLKPKPRYLPNTAKLLSHELIGKIQQQTVVTTTVIM